MKKYDLLAVTQLLENSDKWLGHYYEQYPHLYAHYHYAVASLILQSPGLVRS